MKEIKQKFAGTAARNGNALNRTILDSMLEHIAVLDRDGTIQVTNAAWNRFGAANGASGDGETAPTSVGINYLAVCRGSSGAFTQETGAVYDGIKAVLEGRAESFTFEYPCHAPHEQRWFLLSVTPFDTEEGGAVVTHTNITIRKQMEEALRYSQEQMAAITQAAMDAMITIDDQMLILGFNRAAETVFHCKASEVMGQSVNRLLPQRFHNAHNDHIRRFGKTGMTNRRMGEFSTIMALSAEGNEFPIEASISQVELHGHKLYTVILRDISERKRLEAQLLQAQKMEGIGRLAGGIAHDFNNLLTAILGYTELATVELPADSEVQGYLDHVRKASERAATLTNQLLAFARKQIIAPRILSLNELVLGVHGLLRRLIGEDIEMVSILPDDLWPVKADAGQFEQVLVNLAVNARDAMPTGGKLTIETHNMPLDTEYARIHSDVVPGDYVMLAVSDTGIGMPEAIQQHIFEPFFTTKGPGKGTGLGLATCHGIVKQNGGHIWLDSEPGKGTTFKIFLPRTRDAAVAPPPTAVRRSPRGTETILVVEDEPMVRSMAATVLRLQGYQVLEAREGMEALQILGGYDGMVHLLMTDVIMPQMSGKQLAERIQAMRPEIKVLYASGYTDNTIVHHGVLDVGTAFLQKPYSPLVLANKVRAVLDAA